MFCYEMGGGKGVSICSCGSHSGIHDKATYMYASEYKESWKSRKMFSYSCQEHKKLFDGESSKPAAENSQTIITILRQHCVEGRITI